MGAISFSTPYAYVCGFIFFLVFGGIFWSMVLDWWIIRAGFVVGVAMGVAATYVYVRVALGRAQADVQPSSST